MNGLDHHSRSHDSEKVRIYTICLVKCHEIACTFPVVDYVREVTAKKSFKFGEYGLCEQFLFLLN